MYIGIDGKIERLEENRIYISEAFNFGFSLFETIKVENADLILFNRHVERLNRSLELLGIEHRYDPENLKIDAENIVEFNNFKNGALKILASKNGDEVSTFITLRPSDYPKAVYERGYRLGVSRIRRNEESILPRVKSANFLENLLEKKRACNTDFDDVVFLNTKGNLAETCVSNLFFVKDGTLYTPSEDCGLLKGIVRDLILEISEKENIVSIEGKFRVDDIRNADEVFVTNSLMGVMPVSRIDFSSEVNECSGSCSDTVEYELSCSDTGITSALRREYEKYISEEI